MKFPAISLRSVGSGTQTRQKVVILFWWVGGWLDKTNANLASLLVGPELENSSYLYSLLDGLVGMDGFRNYNKGNNMLKCAMGGWRRSIFRFIV